MEKQFKNGGERRNTFKFQRRERLKKRRQISSIIWEDRERRCVYQLCLIFLLLSHRSARILVGEFQKFTYKVYRSTNFLEDGSANFKSFIVKFTGRQFSRLVGKFEKFCYKSLPVGKFLKGPVGELQQLNP